MDERNVEASPTSFQENNSKRNLILESASYEDLLKVFHFFKEQAYKIYGSTKNQFKKLPLLTKNAAARRKHFDNHPDLLLLECCHPDVEFSHGISSELFLVFFDQ